MPKAKNLTAFIILFSIFTISVLIFAVAGFFSDDFRRITGADSYLGWHNLFEFSGILVSIGSFLVIYYSFQQTKGLRSIILGSTFLITGILDTFHTLTFKGMPAFFGSNMEANRATTYWIIARLIAAAGFLSSALVPADKRTDNIKNKIVISSLLFCALVFILVNYFPGLLPSMYIEGKGLTQTKIVMEYVIIILFVTTAFLYMIEYHKSGDFLAVLFSSSILLVIFSELAFTSYIGVYDVYNYIGHIYKFLAFFIFFRIIFIKNVQLPYVKLSEMQKELRVYAGNLDKLVEERTIQLKEMNQVLLNDLEYARDIQKAVLPSRLPEDESILFEARYFPAQRVGGDFYSIFRLDKDNIAMYIGDVSGHGVPAAMLTIFINQSIKTRREAAEKDSSCVLPSAMLGSLYESYNNTNFKDDIYVVLLYAVYNITSGILTYASAGINAAPLVVRKTGEIEELETTGFPICMFSEYYKARYTDHTIRLNKGDRVFFHTDGLTETFGQNGEDFTLERLKNILLESNNELYQLVGTIENDLFKFRDINNLKDDITFFIMEINDPL